MSHGWFGVPGLTQGEPITHFRAAPCSHQSRKDLTVPLELNRFATVAALLTMRKTHENFFATLFTAGRFYLRSLQEFDRQPEFAYLDLITCGEILSNFDEDPAGDLLDSNTREMLHQIRSECMAGDKIARQLEKIMRQVKRRYTLTLSRLLTRPFFEGSECAQEFGQLKEDEIEKRLKASYDLRSLYVHTGIPFGHWVQPYGRSLYEVHIGRPEIEDRKISKVIHRAPTYFGLERIMRYCLLRFIHLHGVPLDSKLGDDEPETQIRLSE